MSVQQGDPHIHGEVYEAVFTRDEKAPQYYYTRLHSYQWAKSPKIVLFKNKWQNLLPDLSCTPDKMTYDNWRKICFKFSSSW